LLLKSRILQSTCAAAGHVTGPEQVIWKLTLDLADASIAALLAFWRRRALVSSIHTEF